MKVFKNTILGLTLFSAAVQSSVAAPNRHTEIFGTDGCVHLYLKDSGRFENKEEAYEAAKEYVSSIEDIDQFPYWILKDKSSNDILLVSRKDIATLDDLKKRIQPFLFPYAPVNIDDESLLGFREYELSEPTYFNQKLSDTAILKLIDDLPFKIMSVYTGWASPRNSVKNAYVPVHPKGKEYLEETEYIGVVVTPVQVQFQQFLNEGHITWEKDGKTIFFPRHLPIIEHGKMIGMMPIVIENPANFACFFPYGGPPTDEEEIAKFKEAREKVLNERDLEGPFVSRMESPVIWKNSESWPLLVLYRATQQLHESPSNYFPNKQRL